jgi:type IV pilus assembly protein PilE
MRGNLAGIPRPKDRLRGFSLIEILIVIGLVSILLFLALPSYRQFLQRGYRVEAVTQLVNAAACQERIRAASGAYDTRRCLGATNLEHYRLTIEPGGQESVDAYRLVASPLHASGNDACGSLSLDHTGRRGISGPSSNLQDCWSGR